MNKDCQLYYRRLKSLFPSIGFAEGKFLRDMKMHLRDYGIMHSRAKYNEIMKTFGKPEEVYMDYLESQGIEEICNRFQKRRNLRLIIYFVVIIGILVWASFTMVWWKSYEAYNTNIPSDKQTNVIIEGDVLP